MKKHFLILVFISFISFFSCSNSNESQESTGIENIETTFKLGDYTHASFQSTERGEVAFNVYLPANWSKDRAQEYALMILLHGQGEDEFTFLSALPASSLNHWIKKKFIPDNFVLITLRGGQNTNELPINSKSLKINHID